MTGTIHTGTTHAEPDPIPPLAGTPSGLAQVAESLSDIARFAHSLSDRAGPLPSGHPRSVAETVRALLGPGLPTTGIGVTAALRRVAHILLRFGVDLSDPMTAAHLQAPTLPVAVAADALVSAGNTSLDTYDSAGSPIEVERWLIRALADLAGLGSSADGVFTPGGSLSNLIGLLLARDHAARTRGVDARTRGISAVPNPIVLCSELTHFSVHRACAMLGLGEAAVHTIPVDEHRRMRVVELRRRLAESRADHTPIAVVAGAGTTDFGSVDPLTNIAEICAEHSVWLHVDAAHGFGCLFSPTLRSLLTGLEAADSITGDLHKLGWQPSSASVLLVADRSRFAPLRREVDYLNPPDDTDHGYDGLLGHSPQTTRRPDAVKVVATLLAHGTEGIGRLVDACHNLARHAQRRIEADGRLELIAPAVMTTVVFRYRPPGREDVDLINAGLRRRLLRHGEAVIGRTEVTLPDGVTATCLKITLLNPNTTTHDVDRLLGLVISAGDAETAWISPDARTRDGAA